MKRARLTTTLVLLAASAPPLHGQAAPRWDLAPTAFEVGGVTAGPDAEFSELGGVTLLPSGSVVVGDRRAPFLRVFAPDGRFLREVGKRGQGPGEYEYVYGMDWCAPGELSVFDVDARIHRYSGELAFASTDFVLLEALGGQTPYHRDCHPNGLQVVTGWGDIQAQMRVGLYRATARVLLMSGQDVVHDFGERLSSERIGSARDGRMTGSGPHPFGRSTVVALGSDRVYIGDGSSYEVDVHDLSGERIGRLSWSGPSLDYDPDLVRQLAARAVAAAPESRRPRLGRWYADMPEVEQLPAYDRLLVSDTDELWVRLFSRPGAEGEDWVVFGRDGRMVGRVGLPARSRLWEVRGDRVLYSTLDDFDVPVVRISRLIR